MPLRLSIVTLEENSGMCQSSLVDKKAEKITKGLSDIKKKYQGTKKKSKTFHLGETDLNIVTVPLAKIFPSIPLSWRTQLDHGQQPRPRAKRLTLANRIPSPHASNI